MPYQIEDLLKGKSNPVCAAPDDQVAQVLDKMLENDYSQLPVVEPNATGQPVIKGLIRYKDILQGMRHLGMSPENLQVLDVMTGNPPVYHLDDDLFDMLNALQDHNAVLIADLERHLLGILTTWDVMAYFRERSEDMMRVADIESTIKDLILAAYRKPDGSLNEQALYKSIEQVTSGKRDEKEPVPAFERLSLRDYIALLTHRDIWHFAGRVLGRDRQKDVRKRLNAIREIRNALAHFRGDLTEQQRKHLKFISEWLARRVQAWQTRQEGAELTTQTSAGEAPEIEITESESSRSRYARLADWLQNQPEDVDRVRLTFKQIEEIIGTPLPPSAYQHRAWWANDSVGHSHSQQWLEAGWRTSYINLDEQQIDFVRVREREEAYIHFFSRLLDALEKQPGFPLERANVHGKSWIIVRRLPCPVCTGGRVAFAFAFTRDKRFRAELYIDAGDQAISKAIFDRIYAHQQAVEQEFPDISWERLDQRRASRIAVYHEGHILDTAGHDTLIVWAAETMPRLHHLLAPLAEQAMQDLY